MQSHPPSHTLRGHVARAAAWLPRGDTLDPANWARRHRAITRLLLLHVLAVPLYGIVVGQDPVHAIAEGGLIALFAAGAAQRHAGRDVRSAMATLGLVTASAVLTHFSGGLIEMHFHFFVVVAIVALYQSWVPFLCALAFVIIHHGVGGQLVPSAVFNHPSAAQDAWRWAMVHGGFILAESAACLITWRLNEDALARERAARAATEQARNDLAAAQAMSHIGSWEWDVRTGEAWWSAELYRIAGRDPETFTPGVDAFLSHVHAEDRGHVATLLAGARETGAPLDFECRLLRADGVERIVHVCSQHDTADSTARRMLGTCQDVTTQRTLQAELHHRAFHDALTGLPNRALFLDRLQHGMVRAQRTDTQLALVYIDLDDFKSVNDNLGHEVGDELLNALAARLVSTVRESDTVARLGGDEFAVLLEDAGAAGACHVAGVLLDALQEPIDLRGTTITARASMGIAVASRDEEPSDVLRHADIAMYAAKRQGSNGFAVYTEGMQESLFARTTLEAELRTAISADQLVLHYQPLVDLGTDEIRGVEALVRWDHPTRGLLPPSEFVPLAEETGLIAELGTWVLEQATVDVRRLQAATGRSLYVSVNVAAPQLRDDIVGTVRRALAHSRLPAEHLLLEITETCLVQQDGSIVAALQTLRELGVRIAIDDFGTGYSSLAYLRRLPVDHLKIDRAFVRDIAEGPEGSALAHSIIKLGATFGLHVVGEGIESAEQAAVLQRLGCQTGQGYHYQRPTDLESLVAAIGKPLLISS